jgi:hypothetical protein
MSKGGPSTDRPCRRAKEDGEDPGNGDGGQEGDGCFRRTRRQDELEHGDRIAELALERAERAVPPAHGEGRPLRQQEHCRETQASTPNAEDRAPPYDGQRRQLKDAPRDMGDAEGHRGSG